MSSDLPAPDARLAAARYRLDGAAPSESEKQEASEAGRITPEQRAGMVEIAIQQAMRRGEFENLPGAGRPLPGLDRVHDPDWWIRQKIEREGLTGLGPPALTLRAEAARLEARMDALPTEAAVRALLADFNARVVEARRQLQGGPPVVTATRDVEAEVAGWRERRDTRRRELELQRARERAAIAKRSWIERWRAKHAERRDAPGRSAHGGGAS